MDPRMTDGKVDEPVEEEDGKGKGDAVEEEGPI